MTTRIASIACFAVRTPRWLKIVYIIALTALASASLLAKLAIERDLALRAGNTVVVDMAQRQATLSQQLVETATALNTTQDSEERARLRKTFWKTLSRWEEGHRGLQYGDVSLRLPGENSAEIVQRFIALEPSFQNMQLAARRLLLVDEAGSAISLYVGEIAAHDKPFCHGMQSVIAQIQTEARERHDNWQRIERRFSQLAVVVLLLESAFLLLPVIRQLKAIAEASLANYRMSPSRRAMLTVAME